MQSHELALARELIVRRESIKEMETRLKEQKEDVERQLIRLFDNNNGQGFPVTLSDGRVFNISVSEMSRDVPQIAEIKETRPDIWDIIRTTFLNVTRYRRLNVRRIISGE